MKKEITPETPYLVKLKMFDLEKASVYPRNHASIVIASAVQTALDNKEMRIEGLPQAEDPELHIKVFNKKNEIVMQFDATPASESDIKMDMQNKLQEVLGEDFEQMQVVVHRVGIMTAIRNTNNSTDYDVLAKELHKIKRGILSIEQMRELVDKHYTPLCEEGMIKDGKLTDEAREIVRNYEIALDGG